MNELQKKRIIKKLIFDISEARDRWQELGLSHKPHFLFFNNKKDNELIFSMLYTDCSKSSNVYEIRAKEIADDGAYTVSMGKFDDVTINALYGEFELQSLIIDCAREYLDKNTPYNFDMDRLFNSYIGECVI